VLVAKEEYDDGRERDRGDESDEDKSERSVAVHDQSSVRLSARRSYP
jgi:hypothetical protein